MRTNGYLRHFIECNRYSPDLYARFSMAGQAVGFVERSTAQLFATQVPGFSYNQATDDLTLAPRTDTYETRTESLDKATLLLVQQRHKPLRGELYPVIAQYGDTPLAHIDRRAVPWFGVMGFGIHINGFVRKSNEIYMWIGERAQSRGVDPGLLDNMVGGGLPLGLTARDNVRKEAQEEAGLSPAIADQAQYVGSIHYRMARSEGLRNDTVLIYDLDMPEGLIPVNTDGEVAAFHLMPLTEVAQIVGTTERFKFNCNLVIIDFLVRHGFIPPDHPEYTAIRAYCRSPVPAELIEEKPL